MATTANTTTEQPAERNASSNDSIIIIKHQKENDEDDDNGEERGLDSELYTEEQVETTNLLFPEVWSEKDIKRWITFIPFIRNLFLSKAK